MRKKWCFGLKILQILRKFTDSPRIFAIFSENLLEKFNSRPFFSILNQIFEIQKILYKGLYKGWQVCPEEYGGLTSIKVKPAMIWVPDVVLYNSANGHFNLVPDISNTVIPHLFSHGKVRWNVPVELTLSCSLNLEYFPFDYQTCHMKMGSWSYNYDRIRFHLTSNTTDTSLRA